MTSPSNDDPLFLPGGGIRPESMEDGTRSALVQALTHTRRTCWESVRTPHLFMGLLAVPDRSLRDWCRRFGADPQQLLGEFENFFHNERVDPPPPLHLNREFLSDNAIRTLRDAQRRAFDDNRRLVAPYDILVSILASPAGIVAECFERIGIAPKRLLELAILTASIQPRS